MKSSSSLAFDSLVTKKISKASSWQRAGRAGRYKQGYCYRLYSFEQYKQFNDFQEPEIVNACLDNVLLQLFSSGVNNIEQFEFITPPFTANIKTSMSKLMHLKLIDHSDGSKQVLTDLGNFVSLFPLSPELSLAIYASINKKCM